VRLARKGDHRYQERLLQRIRYADQTTWFALTLAFRQERIEESFLLRFSNRL
jgi:hypothetical protein